MDFGAESVRRLLPKLKEATDSFYSGQMSVGEYKSVSGGFGTYAQKSKDRGMVRLRLSGGRIDKTKLKFIADIIGKYRVDMVHLTTCQSVQLHNLAPEAVTEIIDSAMDVGIFTFGGGGDNPRNVTATPLSGAIETPFDVQPYAQCAEKYLHRYVFDKKMPRKLKVGFSNTSENGTDATARDLGFVAKPNGRFDVYSGGGLGPNPRLGLPVYTDAEPEDLCFFLTAMVDMFIACGDYGNRAKARVRYMRETLGDEGYAETFDRFLKKAFADPSIPKANPEPIAVGKKGDGSVPDTGRARKQIQDGLYYVPYHPMGGDPAPGKFGEIYDAIKDIEDAEVRISPAESMYVLNLTGAEADKVAGILSDGSETLFESSVSCVGNRICQQGLRDSRGLLTELIDMERKNGFADGVLPLVRISGCASSCSAHQLGSIGLRGCASIDGEPAFAVNVNGSHILGKERIGEDIGTIKVSKIPAFFETIGKAVEASGMKYREWYNGNPSGLRKLCERYLR